MVGSFTGGSLGLRRFRGGSEIGEIDLPQRVDLPWIERAIAQLLPRHQLREGDRVRCEPAASACAVKLEENLPEVRTMRRQVRRRRRRSGDSLAGDTSDHRQMIGDGCAADLLGVAVELPLGVLYESVDDAIVKFWRRLMKIST